MVVDDEEDIKVLYSDFLSHRDHKVVDEHPNIDTIKRDIERQSPDIYLIDCIFAGNSIGVEIAKEILKQNPSAPYYSLRATNRYMI